MNSVLNPEETIESVEKQILQAQRNIYNLEDMLKMMIGWNSETPLQEAQRKQEIRQKCETELKACKLRLASLCKRKTELKQPWKDELKRLLPVDKIYVIYSGEYSDKSACCYCKSEADAKRVVDLLNKIEPDGDHSYDDLDNICYD